MSAAASRNADILCICGGSLYSSPTNVYERRRNSVYEVIGKNDFDGLVVSGSIVTHCHQDEQAQFFSRFKGMPLVCAGTVIPGFPAIMLTNYEGEKEAVNHMIREHGRTRIVYIRGSLHMLDQCERYRGYCDALNENGIPLDLDLVIQADFSPEGGQKIVRKLIDSGISFDAIVSVNDGMILSTLAELRRRHIRIPEDVALCGFDDIEDTSICVPAVTTVHQSVGELGRMSINMLCSMIDGADIPEITYIKTSLVVRESCGCLSVKPVRTESIAAADGECNTQQIADELLDAVIRSGNTDYSPIEMKTLVDLFVSDVRKKSPDPEFLRRLLQVLSSQVIAGNDILIWHEIISKLGEKIFPYFSDRESEHFLFSLSESGADLVANMTRRIPSFRKMEIERLSEMLMVTGSSIGSIYDINLLVEAVVNSLPSYNVHDFMLFLCGDDLGMAPSHDLVPKEYILFSAMRNGEIVDIPESYTRFLCSGFYGKFFDFCSSMGMNAMNMLIEPVFFRDFNFGFVVFPGDIPNSLVFETMGRQIGSSLMGGMLYREQTKAEHMLLGTLAELEQSNDKLAQLSTIDELTGLYNRRGFYSYADHQRSLSKRMGRGFVLFYADMDNLKIINDIHGHNEGDKAIRAIADILKGTFRKSDIISRIGGDEFVILSTDTLSSDAGMIIDKVMTAINVFNDGKHLPYSVGLTMGFSEYVASRDDMIDKMLVIADKALYENKKKKKKAKLS